MYKLYIKPLIDRVIALSALIVLSPVFVMIMISLIIANKGTPFFFQLRPGKGEKIFKIVKFKSMSDAKGAEGKLLPDAKRLTKLGVFIRKASLDEIPQLINVVRGEMSIVGPRPLLVEYLKYYTKEEKLRHVVRPGITGLAQINGRNNLDWDRRLALDVQYVCNITFVEDFKIIVATIKNVFIGKDVAVVAGEKFGKLSDYRKVCK
jgi:undecaprenyl phosphate N,N'-diacetylbacillosamine 1-phosphate transferase